MYLIQWLEDTFYDYGQYLRNCLFMPISVSDFLRYMTDVYFITDISIWMNSANQDKLQDLARINYCPINLDVFNQSTTNVQKLWNCSLAVLLQNTFEMSFAKYWPFCFVHHVVSPPGKLLQWLLHRCPINCSAKRTECSHFTDDSCLVIQIRWNYRFLMFSIHVKYIYFAHDTIA